MSRNEKVSWLAWAPLVILLVVALCNDQSVEPSVQADVYDALYEAHVQCDDELASHDPSSSLAAK